MDDWSEFSLTPFQRRLKAAVIIGLAAAVLKPIYAATFTGVYLVLAEVTSLSELVCPRTWAMRVLGGSIVVAVSLFLGNTSCLSDVYSWALPFVMFAALAAVEYVHPMVFFRWYRCRWRPGTEVMITRVAQRGYRENHKISWLVHATEELSREQLGTISHRFREDCPQPKFDQPSDLEPSVDICLRVVQFWTSQEGHLMRRVSRWCTPRSDRHVEFEFPPSPLHWIDSNVSGFFGTVCLMAVPFVVTYADDREEWCEHTPIDRCFFVACYVLIFVHVGICGDLMCNLLIRGAHCWLASLFHSACWWTRITLTQFAMALRWMTAAGVTVMTDFAMALRWMTVEGMKVAGYLALVFVFSFMRLLGFVAIGLAWEFLNALSSSMLLWATAVIGAARHWAHLVHANVVRGFTQAWDALVVVVATAFSAALAIFAFVRSASLCLAWVSGVVCVTAILARALVLAMKAARDKCKSLLAVGYRGYRQHAILKAWDARQPTPGRRRKLGILSDGDKKKDSTAVPLVDAAGEDLIRQAAGERMTNLRCSEVTRQAARSSYETQKSLETAAPRHHADVLPKSPASVGRRPRGSAEQGVDKTAAAPSQLPAGSAMTPTPVDRLPRRSPRLAKYNVRTIYTS